MHKLLPKSARNPRGFTLIELLVVISIIAILAVIGIAIFSGVTARGRNAKRRGDVGAIIAAFEANKSPTDARYTVMSSTWFSGATYPEDPNGRGPNLPQYNLYYVNNATGYVIGNPTAWGATAASPTTTPATVSPDNTGTVSSAIVINNANPGSSIPGSGTVMYSLIVCTLLEPEAIGVGMRTIHCRNSSQ